MREKKQCKGCYRVHSPFFGPDSVFHGMAQSFCLTCIRNGPALPESFAEYEVLSQEIQSRQQSSERIEKQRLHS